jgi:hypothetical protein
MSDDRLRKTVELMYNGKATFVQIVLGGLGFYARQRLVREPDTTLTLQELGTKQHAADG